jgi:transposase
MGKSSGPSGPQQVTQTTTNLPAYAEPFYRNLLERATFESERPLETYPGQRLADFDPYEQQAMSGIADMAYAGDPIQMQQASELAAAVGYQDPNQAMQIANAYRPSAQYSGYFAGDIDSGYDAGALDNRFRADQVGQGYEAERTGARISGTTYRAGISGTTYRAGISGRTYRARISGTTYRAGVSSRSDRSGVSG